MGQFLAENVTRKAEMSFVINRLYDVSPQKKLKPESYLESARERDIHPTPDSVRRVRSPHAPFTCPCVRSLVVYETVSNLSDAATNGVLRCCK